MSLEVINNHDGKEQTLLPAISSSTEVAWRVADAMRGVGGFLSAVDVYSCAYLAYFIKSSDKPCASLSEAAAVAAGDDPIVQEAIDNAVANVDVDRFLAMTSRVSLDGLRTYLLAGPVTDSPMSGESSTPNGIVALALSILDVREGDKVVDFGSGVGGFLEHAAIAAAGARLVGVELNSAHVAAARMRAKVSGSDVAYECDDMFTYYEDVIASSKVDKAFSNYPWGMRAKHLEGRSEYLEKVLKGMSEYGRPTSADWVFNRLLVDSITEDGLAVGIMTNGAAFNGADVRVRKYFIENGWIRAAVSLPAGVFAPWTNIGTTLIVLAHGGMEGVRLVDATDLGTKERRGVTFTEEDVQVIVERLGADSEKSALVSVEELAGREYTLSANRFLQKEIKLTNPVAFGDLIVNVTRGASLRAKELDGLTCNEDTGIRYLNLGNITDGSIDEELPCLKELDPKLERYCLKTGDLLLSKNGAPYKAAVAEVPEGQKILANGNLYIIKLNTEKMDPYYAAAFLNSPDGKETLARASKGTVIPNLPLSELRAIKLPLETAETQARVAAAYRAKLEEIGVLKLRLARAREELVDLFNEEA